MNKPPPLRYSIEYVANISDGYKTVGSNKKAVIRQALQYIHSNPGFPISGPSSFTVTKIYHS